MPTRPTPADPSAPPPISEHLLAFLVGALFLFSAWTKLVGLIEFEAILLKQELAPDRATAAMISRLLSAFEIFLGAGLIQTHLRRRLFIPAAATLLVIFTGYLTYAIISGNTENCGCFSTVIAMTPGEAWGKNIILLAMLAGMWRVGKKAKADARWALPSALAILPLVVIFIAFPLKDSIPPGTGDGTGPDQADNTSAFLVLNEFDGGEDVDFSTETLLVAFLSLDCDHCRELATSLGELQQTGSLPPMLFAFIGDPDQAPDFMLETGTDADMVFTDNDAFFRFIDSAPPQVYYLHGGRVRRTWVEDTFAPDRFLTEIEEATP